MPASFNRNRANYISHCFLKKHLSCRNHTLVQAHLIGALPLSHRIENSAIVVALKRQPMPCLSRFLHNVACIAGTRKLGVRTPPQNSGIQSPFRCIDSSRLRNTICIQAWMLSALTTDEYQHWYKHCPIWCFRSIHQPADVVMGLHFYQTTQNAGELAIKQVGMVKMNGGHPLGENQFNAAIVKLIN